MSALSIPELRVHLVDDRAAWLATWFPDGSFGRPLPQVGGPAFWPALGVSKLVSEPAQFNGLLGWLGVLAAWISGAFWFAGGTRSVLWRWLASGAVVLVPVLVGHFRVSAWGAPPAAVTWALASSWLGLTAVRAWFLAKASEDGGAPPTRAWWSIAVLAFALHSVALAAPLPVARDVSVVLAGAALYFASRCGGWRRVNGIAWAFVAALFTVSPVFLDQWNQRSLPEVHGEPADALPMLLPGAAGEEVSPGRWSLDLAHPGYKASEFELDVRRTDQLSWKLPKEQGTRLLVLPVRFDPRWRPFFKGRETSIICVNDVYLGVLVTKRAFEVSISFVPLSPLVLLAQLGFALLAIGGAIAWGMGELRRKRESP